MLDYRRLCTIYFILTQAEASKDVYVVLSALPKSLLNIFRKPCSIERKSFGLILTIVYVYQPTQGASFL